MVTSCCHTPRWSMVTPCCHKQAVAAILLAVVLLENVLVNGQAQPGGLPALPQPFPVFGPPPAEWSPASPSPPPSAPLQLSSPFPPPPFPSPGAGAGTVYPTAPPSDAPTATKQPLFLPDGSFPATNSPPPLSELNRDSLAGATSIVPFEGVLESLQSSTDEAALTNLDAPGKPLSTLNAELLLSGQSIVPFNASMQLRTMHVLSGLLQEFPHVAELKTVGEVAIMLQPGQVQPPAQVSLTDLALINMPVSPEAMVRYVKSALAPAPSDAVAGDDLLAGLALIDPAPAPMPNLSQHAELTARSGRRLLLVRLQRWLAEVSGGQYSFMVNGSQHVALNITISAADAYMQTALKSLEKSINNFTLMQRLNDAGVMVDKIQVLLIRVTTPQSAPLPIANAPELSSTSPPPLQPPVQPMNNATAVIPAPPGGLSPAIIGGIVAGGVAMIVLVCSIVYGYGTRLRYRNDLESTKANYDTVMTSSDASDGSQRGTYIAPPGWDVKQTMDALPAPWGQYGQGQFIRAASGGQDMGTIQEDGMLAHLPQRSGNFDGSLGGLVSTPPSSRKPQSSPTAAKHLQNDSVLQMFSSQHLFRNDTAADPALLRGGSSDTDPCGAGGSADLSLPESGLEQSPSVFSRMQSGHLARIDHNLWQVHPKDLLVQRQIGEGSFGKVYLAKWRETTVAVKVLISTQLHLGTDEDEGYPPPQQAPNPLLSNLVKEATMMAALRHPNVVMYLGVCLDPPMVLTEYCARGSLNDVLKRAFHSPTFASQLDWPRRLNMALDAAKGMNYLHTSDPPVIHRDLKSPNLLVDKHWRVKVGDFNLSRVLEEHAVVSSLAATNPRWLAPEILSGRGYTFSSDVYSFGIILWEFLTWRLPWHDMGPWQVVKEVTDDALRPAIPEDLPTPSFPGQDEYIELMQDCWQQDEATRPTFSQVIMRLRKLLHNETERLRRCKAVAGKEAVSSKAPERTRGLSDPVCDASTPDRGLESPPSDKLSASHKDVESDRDLGSPQLSPLLNSSLSITRPDPGGPTVRQLSSSAVAEHSRDNCSLTSSSFEQSQSAVECSPGQSRCIHASCSEPQLQDSNAKLSSRGQHASLSLPSSPHRPGSCGLGQGNMFRHGSSPGGTPSRLKSGDFLGGLEIVGCESAIYGGGISISPRVGQR